MPQARLPCLSQRPFEVLICSTAVPWLKKQGRRKLMGNAAGVLEDVPWRPLRLREDCPRSREWWTRLWPRWESWGGSRRIPSGSSLSLCSVSLRQAARLVELLSKHDFPRLLESLSRSRSGGGQRHAPLPPDFFPCWIRRAGGYFPKFAQVLSVRADLLHGL